jgi:TRAP transporter TAXI family solute receptor
MSRLGCLLTATVASAVLVASAATWAAARPTLPPELRVGAGKKGGLYYSFAEEFARVLAARTGRPARAVETEGSAENAARLRAGTLELALLQTSPQAPEGVVGVAPLFPEPLHVLVRRGKDAPASPADLKGKRVALGLEGSSIRRNALTVLAYYGVPADAVTDAGHFAALEKGTADAALVTTGWMNPALEQILRSGDVELVGLPDAEALAARHPWFAPHRIPPGMYGGRPEVPATEVRTVAVTALLTARADAPDDVVREALAALYESDLRAAFPGLTPQKAARDHDPAGMHPAVAAYHDPAVRFNRLSRMMEVAAKSKEVVFGAGAVAVLVWGWVRRRRERRAAAADEEQKRKLDEFIGRTLTVELEQMDVTDPEALRPFLRRVTQIKQEALRELTSEKVRGDQLFAIFLAQCAALSDKLQLRMIYGRLSKGP